MANFDHLFCINDSGFFFLEMGKKIMIVFNIIIFCSDVVGLNVIAITDLTNEAPPT